MTIIYKYTNLINGRVYVGKTSQTLFQRHHQHRFGRHSPFNDALRKYGIKNFELESLIEVEPEFSSFAEMIFISALKANNRQFGYNITAGGEGTVGYRHRGETKERISQKLLGRSVSQDFRQKMGLLKRGNTNCLGLKRSQKDKDAIRSRMLGNQNGRKTRRRHA